MFRNDWVPTQLESGTKKPFQENEEEMFDFLLLIIFFGLHSVLEFLQDLAEH